MGTPDFAVPSLKALVEAGHDVLAVVTQPDRPRGRGRKETPPPVKQAAHALNIPVFQPLKIKDADFTALLKKLSPQVIAVVAYGRIIPPDILTIPKYGCINVHASLLPKYRGAAPIHWAVINGEKETGITTMFMDEGLDTGDMILQEAVAITEEDTAGTVHDALAVLGARLLVQTLELVGQGMAPRVPQQGIPSYAPPLKTEDELIRWDRTARDIFNQIRGMNPWPGARTYFSGKVLKIWRAAVVEEEGAALKPGQVMSAGRNAIVVGTGRGRIAVTELQLQGARRLSAGDFLRGTPMPEGIVLGEACS